MCVHVRAASLRQKHLWCVMEQSSGVHFWAEGSKHCCVYWICSAYWICSVSESFCLENYWKTDLTGQTESGQFLRSVSMISSLFFRRKFGFSGTGGKIEGYSWKDFQMSFRDKWQVKNDEIGVVSSCWPQSPLCSPASAQPFGTQERPLGTHAVPSFSLWELAFRQLPIKF